MGTDIAIVHVELGDRAYSIEIGSGLLGGITEFLRARTRVTHAVIITDSNVVEPYANAARRALESSGIRVDILAIDAGEASKSVESADRLWQQMLACRADRTTVVIAVGGGVVGDLGGFVAATYARGLTFIQVPTTLLAHVDSSVGGKVGVNLPGAKNLVGAFWQPAGVLIDLETLDTLPEREYRAGLAEVVKYGVILDEAFFALLESRVEKVHVRDRDTLQRIIARCCELKAHVVRHDERETTGLRAVLNYGHTFCHAFETVTGYGHYLHGEAVSIGMVCAAQLAHSLGRVDEAFCSRQRRLLTELKLPVTFDTEDNDALLGVMRHDKKTEHGRLRFVLPSRMGHVELVDGIDAEQVREVLDKCRG